MSYGNDDNDLGLKLSNMLSSIDPGDTETLEEAITHFNDEEELNRRSDVSSQTSREIVRKMMQFHSMTDLIGQMNEAQNANIYAKDMIDKEQKRINRLDMQLRTELYKTQQKFLSISYRRKHYRFITNVMLFTIAVVALLSSLIALFFQRLLPTAVFAITISVLVICYVVVIVVAFSYENRRRRFHWRKFYWDISDKMKKAMKESNDVGDCK